MESVRVAATIIELPDSYILHQRNPGIDKGEEDKIGLYGGQIEDYDENEWHAVSRELKEESGVLFAPEAFNKLGFVHVVSERDGQGVLTEAEIFELLPREVTIDSFKSGVPMTPREISRARALGQLSSVAAAALIKFKGV